MVGVGQCPRVGKQTLQFWNILYCLDDMHKSESVIWVTCDGKAPFCTVKSVFSLRWLVWTYFVYFSIRARLWLSICVRYSFSSRNRQLIAVNFIEICELYSCGSKRWPKVLKCRSRNMYDAMLCINFVICAGVSRKRPSSLLQATILAFLLGFSCLSSVLVCYDQMPLLHNFSVQLFVGTLRSWECTLSILHPYGDVLTHTGWHINIGTFHDRFYTVF